MYIKTRKTYSDINTVSNTHCIHTYLCVYIYIHIYMSDRSLLFRYCLFIYIIRTILYVNDHSHFINMHCEIHATADH